MLLQAVHEEKDRIGEILSRSKIPELAPVFVRCYPVTAQTTVETAGKADSFLITGDIPAMWLRDSTAQVRHYLALAARDGETADFIEGLSHRQFFCVEHDPYANAFNREPTGRHCCDRDNCDDPLVWERKYEVDSLCAPVELAYALWKATGRTGQFDGRFFRGIGRILDLWEAEQRHGNSPYTFVRPDTKPHDTLSHGGLGAPVGYTGMTWSGFRPSDDGCVYGYLIPSNLFAATALSKMAEIAEAIRSDAALAARARRLQGEIVAGVLNFGVVNHEKFGKMYAYETDGLGHFVLQDDANVPSLLSIPYLGFGSAQDELYENTRRFVLSGENPFFFSGRHACGVGSPHTPRGYVWPIALCMQGLTSRDPDEQRRLLRILASTHDGTLLMHESFDADQPSRYTRPWFAWACSLFCEFVQHCLAQGIL